MIEDIKQDTEERMGKALEALAHNFNKSALGGHTPVCWTAFGSSTTAQRRR